MPKVKARSIVPLEESLAEKLHEAFCAGVRGLNAELGKSIPPHKWAEVGVNQKRGYVLMAKALLLSVPPELIEAAAARNRPPVAPTGAFAIGEEIR